MGFRHGGKEMSIHFEKETSLAYVLKYWCSFSNLVTFLLLFSGWKSIFAQYVFHSEDVHFNISTLPISKSYNQLQPAKPTAVLWDKTDYLVLMKKQKLKTLIFPMVTSQGSGFLQTLTKQHSVLVVGCHAIDFDIWHYMYVSITFSSKGSKDQSVFFKWVNTTHFCLFLGQSY